MEGREELNDISYLQPALHLALMMAKRRGGLMKGTVGYGDKAAAPTLQAHITLMTWPSFAFVMGPGVVCVMLIKRLHSATATGHLPSVRLYLHWGGGDGRRKRAMEAAKSRGEILGRLRKLKTRNNA